MELTESITPGSRFIWAEALFLTRWNIHVWPRQQHIDNIKTVCGLMNLIRDEFRAPIIVNSWLRPTAYNALIGGASRSAHIDGLAVDFVIRDMSCNYIRDVLKTKLDLWDFRLENNAGSWIHVDKRNPGPGGRFFRP